MTNVKKQIAWNKGKSNINFCREDFIREYFDKKQSIRQLIKIFHVSDKTLLKYAKTWGLKLRSIKESTKLAVDNGHRRILFGENNPSYKGGNIMKSGYKRIIVNGEYRLEHRYIWEKYHNKLIPDGFQIHHINGDKLDNRVENLLCLSNSDHQKLHNQARNDSGQFISK